MGRHASAETRRGVAAWPVILFVVVLLLTGLTVGYFFLTRDKPAAACTGHTVLPVTASPGAIRAVNDAAAVFNGTAPVARSTCISVSVTGADGADAAAALANGWKDLKTPAPALWVVDSVSDLAALDATNSAMTAGHTNATLAISPVVLAMRTAPTMGGITWTTAARSGLVLTLPDPQTNRASGYALESIVAASTGSAKAVDTAGVAAARATLSGLAAAGPTPPATTQAALTELAAGQAGFTAVPVVESELAAFNAANATGLTAVHPQGPTAGDELLAVPLTASWVTGEMSDAAAAFDAFLATPKGIAVLAAADLRTAGPSGSRKGVDMTTKVASLPDSSVAVRKVLQVAWATARGGSSSTSTIASSSTTTSSTATSSTATSNTATSNTASSSRSSTAPTTVGQAITLVLDRSASMATVDGKQRRIEWMQAAVNASLGSSPSDLFSLWSVSTTDGSSGYAELVPIGSLTDQVGGDTRATAITNAVNSLIPRGDSWVYGAIRAAYTDAVNNAVVDRKNRVIVVTDGADSTPGLPRAGLEAALVALAAQNKSVMLDIVGLPGNSHGVALTGIAQAGGGTYTPLSAMADLQSALLGLFTG